MMTARENYLKAARFERPDYIPMTYAINPACFDTYDHDELFSLMEDHKLLFPGFQRPQEPFCPAYAPVARKDEPFTDDFGCVWTTSMNGITGTVTVHPLDDWSKFKDYCPPDPRRCVGIGPIDWEAERRRVREAKERGELVIGGLRHGHTFLQLCDIRGYEELLFDMTDEDEHLPKLIQMVEEFNAHIIAEYLAMGVDVMSYAEDLGMQVGPMLSPELFQTYIKPSYQRLMAPAKKEGMLIHMHSDGDIRSLVDDLFDGGVDIINLQDLVNGIDWIADTLAGKHCMELDVDRQAVTVNGTPDDIEKLFHEEVTKIGRREGGLMMIFGLYPGTPIQNAKAVMDCMEKYMFYFD